MEIGVKRCLSQRGETEPAPYTRAGAGRCIQDGGVWSPRPTGATQVVPSSGPMWESVLFTMDGGSGRRGRRPLRKARSTTQASRRAAKRPRQRPRGMGGNRRKDHPKRGTTPATAWAALSEAESAGRGAGQIRVLPDNIGVRHGVSGPEVSARLRPCSGRGCRVSGEDSLGPHPVVQENAERPGCTTTKAIFLPP